MLVSINSALINDIITFQNLKVDCNVHTQGEAYYAKQSTYYFST